MASKDILPYYAVSQVEGVLLTTLGATQVKMVEYLSLTRKTVRERRAYSVKDTKLGQKSTQARLLTAWPGSATTEHEGGTSNDYNLRCAGITERILEYEFDTILRCRI